MISQLTTGQRENWRRFRKFADTALAPRADMCDAEQELPRPIVKDLADEGWISSLLPEDWGGSARDTVTYGLMSEEMGRACSTVRNFVAVEDMVSHSIWKWGTPAQRARWLPAVAAGEAVLAFALTEPGVGSDAKSVTTEARPDGPDLVLNGVKEWISFGQLADGFLVFTQYEGHHTAFLVDRDSPGIYVEPLRNLLGLRGSMLARITFDECRIPSDAMVGRPGSGLAFVASSALDIGRYSTAWGCVGLAQACLDASTGYAEKRTQYDSVIMEHQLVQRMLADMITGVRAARLLCWEAGVAKETRAADAVHQTLVAKYFSSAMANRVASDAVQIHGARGIGGESPVARPFRDAKVMEIIEGTTQIHQTLLGRWSSRVHHPADDSVQL